MIAFILYKDLGASPIQITALVAVKPVVAVFSSYWNGFFPVAQGCLKVNLVVAMVLGSVPALFFPFFDSAWPLVISFGIYFFAERAIMPAWMELVKVSFTRSDQSQVVSHGSLIMFMTSAALPILVAPFLDHYNQSWKWIFPVLGVISLGRLPFLLYLAKLFPSEQKASSSSVCTIFSPFKEGHRLLCQRPDFAFYQLIFFCGGLGLMVMQPCLPEIVQTNLKLSYKQIAAAVALCKGVGFAVARPAWSRALHKTNIFKYCAVAALFAAFSILFILLSEHLPLGIYFAFVLYGIMQAGSQLSWQLGGPIFSPKSDSSVYTNVNVTFVGIKGCLGPLLGGLLHAKLGAAAALYVGSIFCFLGFCLGYFGSVKIPLLHQSRDGL